MSEAAIKVEGLGKKYLLRHQAGGRHRYVALRDVLTGKFKGLFNRKADGGNRKLEEFWALQDVSFEIKQGEAVGIIGRNGAGKSTLLKLLSRITEPSKGRFELEGRVASLLEVGTGFHPELTGRENIFLNGAILGMHRAEIKQKFDEIVAFAEVERFLDTPVKHFSSGMYMRLAFAVAAHLEQEIMIVDEVLAVGDAQFQKKCLGKMQDVSQKQGRTVLFVSHNIAAVLSLCSRGIYLKSGKTASIGTIREAVHDYLADGAQKGYEICFENTDLIAGDNVVRVERARILGPTGVPQGEILVSDQAWVEVQYEILNPDPLPRLNLHFSTEDGVYAFASIENTNAKLTRGRYRCRMQLPANFLNSKSYVISIYVSSFQPTHVHVELKDVLVLNVTDETNSITRQTYNGPFPGAIRPVMYWEIERV